LAAPTTKQQNINEVGDSKAHYPEVIDHHPSLKVTFSFSINAIFYIDKIRLH
jgi:hypothetical protein